LSQKALKKACFFEFNYRKLIKIYSIDVEAISY